MRQASAVKRTTVTSRAPKNRLETSQTQVTYSQEDSIQKIQQKAYELFVARGCAHGYDVEDWIKAEQIIKGA